MPRLHRKRGGKVDTRSHHPRRFSPEEYNAMLRSQETGRRRRQAPNIVFDALHLPVPDYQPPRRRARLAVAAAPIPEVAAAVPEPEYEYLSDQDLNLESGENADVSMPASDADLAVAALDPEAYLNPGLARALHPRRSSNLYIYPGEALRFLMNSGFVQNNMINLAALASYFQDLRRNPADVDLAARRFFAKSENRASNPDGFWRFSVSRLLTGKFGVPPSTSKNIWPRYVDGKLSIPCVDVMDLPMYIMIYILYKLANSEVSAGNALVSYSLQSVALGLRRETRYPITNSMGRSVIVTNHYISLEDLLTIYTTILRNFVSILPGDSSLDNFGLTWNGSEESGTRIRLLNWGRKSRTNRLYLMLHLTRVPMQSRGRMWTQEIEDFIRNALGNCVMSVRNRNDNRCLLYCIILGLFLKVKEGTSRIFGVGKLMIEDSEIYAKAAYFATTDADPISEITRHLGRCLLAPSYSTGPIDPLFVFVNDLDKKVTLMTSIPGFREEFKEIEAKLIPNGACGIDVYGMDYNINKHIYPLYISPHREKVIQLLCVTPPHADFSHYCLITNFEKLLQRSGGKQFFSCSRCGKCFYHRRLIYEHNCPALPDPGSETVGGEYGYHYSVKTADPDLDEIVGVCHKCRLCFISEFQYSYHKEHCLMKGINGYRHVQLVTYSQAEHPTLNGQELDEEKEDQHVLERRVLYADFESSINPETGEHTFMSYGIYDWDSEEYKCGYQLKEFIDFIVETAYAHSEDHIYIYFHNAMGYDANFILKYVLKSEECRDWGIQVIMKSSNKLQKLVFYVFKDDTKRKVIHICDTFMFLTLSLEKIVGSIRKDDLIQNEENFSRFFQVFRQRYPFVRDEDLDAILKKNIFPYRFFTDSSKLDTPKEDFMKIFEPKEENLKFFSERVTVEDLEKSYDETKNVFEIFRLMDARGYHDLYLCCDVMQLADVFDRSMNILWESHHIHLTRYLGMPSASWAAFLRFDPKMSIPLYEDTFFAEFFKDMIRGGITSAPLRYAEADERHSIIYLDVNGLYPYVMQAYKFPCGRFEFVPMGWTGEQCISRLKEYFDLFERCGNRGMCFCVDMHIPDSVKEVTDMYPFAPEHRKIFSEYFEDEANRELTPFLRRWSEANEGQTMKEFNGLVCTLYDKVKYNVHWRLLKFYMEHGVVITKVWFGVSFEEGDYLAGYIRKNIEIRNGRKDELGKTLYKLLGNSIYGKTFESPFKRNTYEIIRDPIKLQGMLNEGNIAAMTPIDDMGWIVKMDGEDIVLDKPTYIGACVCEFAKLHMYTLLYDKLTQIFPGTPVDPGCRLVYTDTDSFIVRVKHPDGVPGFNPKALFDYIKSKDPTLIGPIGGQVKSETGEDDTISKIIALRSKVYAYKTLSKHLGKRAKGTTHDAQEMQLSWKSYKETLKSLRAFDTTSSQIVRDTFGLTSSDVTRQSLSVNDGKRYICEDGIETFAFGNPKIPH